MTYKDVTILQAQQLERSRLINMDNVYEIGKDILNIFEGIDKKEVDQWSVNYFNKRLKKYKFLSTELPSDEWVKEFECQGKTYTVMQTPDKWNISQFSSIAALTKSQEEIMNNCHTIIAVMVSKNAGLDEIKETADTFRNHLSIDVAFPIAVFFLAVMSNLPSSIVHYLKEVRERGSQISGGSMMP